LGDYHILGALISALLYSLTFPPFNFHWLVFVALVPLIWVVSRPQSLKKQFLNGFIFGTIVMGIFHVWLFSLTPFAPLWGLVILWSLLSVYYGLFYGAGMWVFGWLKPYCPRIILLPAVWIVFEWLRALGPFGNTAASAGYTMTTFPHLLQLASVGGLYGLSFFVVLANVVFISLFKREGRWGFGLLLLLVIASFTLFNSPEKKSLKPISVAIIQGNHDQSMKFSFGRFREIRDSYLDLSRTSKHADVIIWPETITPQFNLDNALFLDSVRDIAQTQHNLILLGTPYLDHSHFYNALAAVGYHDTEPLVYHKYRLMPFGEYWPLRSVLIKASLGSILPQEDFTPASSSRVLKTADYTIANAICLESIYPWYVRKQVLEGGQWITVVANHAWYFNSSAAAKHLQMGQLRAVENHRYLAQASNMGISAIIDPNGHIQKQTKLNSAAVLQDVIYVGLPLSFYTRFGDWIVCLSTMILFFAAVFRLFRYS
jgi:apolipoprotein N-acyltransferase